MPRPWIEPRNIQVPESFTQSIGGSSISLQVLYSRGFTEPENALGFIDPHSYHPASPLELPDLEKLTSILHKAISDHHKIGVWGDFDVDGQTATTILVSALRQLGADVVFHIPYRAAESHGIGIPSLEKFLQTGVKLILTCDTGVTSHEAIAYANRCGIPVLVSDHHDLPAELPDAVAIVNPKRLPPDHPLSTLPGVGVAYKIIEHLFDRLGKPDGVFQYLDLVALGIVADLATLKNDTRYLLQLGLEALRSTPRLGLRSMMEFAELDPSHLTEEHISFILAPRMNASGRLADANQMVEFLTTTDISRARILAVELEGMNAQRKLLTDQVFQAAQSQLDQQPKLLDSAVIVLSHPSWPAGVIGIVASHLVELYHRPVILFSSPPGSVARGSARSIDGIHITQAISATQHLLKSFGGHPMAAGLSIDPTNIPQFQRSINEVIQRTGIEIKKEKELRIDAYVSLPSLNLSLVEDLERLAPFGPGNPPLVLAAKNLSLTGYSTIGKNDDHLQLTVEDELGYSHRSIWWQAAGHTLPEGPFDLAFSVRASTYRGQRDIQIEWIDYRLPVSPAPAIYSKSKIEVIDHRQLNNPLGQLKVIQGMASCIIWGEVVLNNEINCLDRNSLCPSNVLVIWTVPPGNRELQAAIQVTKPSIVHLFGNDPGMDHPEAFLKRLLGLLKFSIKALSGMTRLSIMAAATAQRIATVKLGLKWLEAHGHICIIKITDDQLQIEISNARVTQDTQVISNQLRSALLETAAFRRYYLKADKNRLLTSEPSLE